MRWGHGTSVALPSIVFLAHIAQMVHDKKIQLHVKALKMVYEYLWMLMNSSNIGCIWFQSRKCSFFNCWGVFSALFLKWSLGITTMKWSKMLWHGCQSNFHKVVIIWTPKKRCLTRKQITLNHSHMLCLPTFTAKKHQTREGSRVFKNEAIDSMARRNLTTIIDLHTYIFPDVHYQYLH
jgi:hypothetical protein